MPSRDRLIAALHDRANGRKRVQLDVIWDAFRSTVRGYTGDADARPQLAALLRELEEDGVLSQPKTRQRWDHTAAPPLPYWVALVPQSDAPPPGSTRDHRHVAWPAPMVFVSELRNVGNLDELLAIRAFLAAGGANRPLVPVRERSVELFGDEKRLDALAKGALFRPGRLSFDLLRCREVAPPLTFEAVPASKRRTALILETGQRLIRVA